MARQTPAEAKERDEAFKTYTDLANLYDAQGKQLMEMNDLKSKINTAYNLKWDQEKRLDQQILDAKVDLPIMKNKANDLIAKKNRLTERETALNDSQKDLEKEKQALDHFRLEYEQAKTQLEQQNTNLSQLEKDIAPLRVTAQQYLENTYQKEMQSRQEAFDKAREAREKQILDKKQSMETIDAQIKSLYKQHGLFGWPADATKNYNQLQSVMDTLKSEYKQLETDAKNALKDYEAKNKELQKEYQKPTSEKLKETDEFLKSSLKDYNDKVTARNEAEARMNRMKTAFENQQTIYQNKKTTFDQEQNQYNIDKESITFACTEAVKAYNDAVTQNKERKTLVATLKKENAETYKLLAKANKDYADLHTEQLNTRQKREEQGRVVDRLGLEHSQMLKAKPTLENLSQQPQQQPQPQQVKPQAGPSMGGMG